MRIKKAIFDFKGTLNPLSMFTFFNLQNFGKNYF